MLDCLKATGDTGMAERRQVWRGSPAVICAGEQTGRVDRGGAVNFTPDSAEGHLSRLTFYNARFFLCLQGHKARMRGE